ncbi:hypothetical protein [Reinekea marinisedimentorum]|uniref:Transcriptional regulator SutA RNAP-binding domain-containing protein n=1 Tax=Reinekea marinisedimentorum TaxID=230495 RepID=A0A4R3I0Z2_9GAMM|nr:hypothetical protein [Reinekea marinisedimentorum]TCS38245.1 hypothetical protein BCF53_11656 [Reinekea marinisedimentorum]
MTVAKKTSEGPVTSEELARTPKCNENLRTEMASDVESFLANGGSVTEVETGYRADPPKKPENKYGSRPI